MANILGAYTKTTGYFHPFKRPLHKPSYKTSNAKGSAHKGLQVSREAIFSLICKRL